MPRRALPCETRSGLDITPGPARTAGVLHRARSPQAEPLAPKHHAANANVRGRVREQRHEPSSLKREGQRALVVSARPGLASGFDFCAVRQIPA